MYFLAVPFVGLVVLSMCCVFSLLCHWLVPQCCCLCAVYFPCCAIYWSRSAVYVLCIFLAVSFVGLAVLSMCCVFSCCAICWSRSAVYVLCILLAVSFVGLVVLSMCCVFSCCAICWSRSAVYVLCIFLLCHWLVPQCC